MVGVATLPVVHWIVPSTSTFSFPFGARTERPWVNRTKPFEVVQLVLPVNGGRADAVPVIATTTPICVSPRIATSASARFILESPVRFRQPASAGSSGAPP